MKVLPYGRRAVLVEVGGQEEVHALYRRLRAAPPPGAVDIVAGARTVLVTGVSDPGAFLAAGPGSAGGPEVDRPSPERLLTVPVTYDGPDLEQVAAAAGLSAEEVVSRHTGAEWTVGFLGFSPGFAYLTGGDPTFDVPRLATPRAAVPAGSVAVAGGMTAVYPQRTPGGWQLIGRTTAVMFDPDRSPPAAFEPGDRVRFVSVRTATRVRTAPAPRAVPGPDYLHVDDPGPLTTVQDLGRPGWAHMGVSPAGAADRAAAVAANRLVGNPDGAAVLETTLSGPRLRLGAARVVAVTGADCEVTVDGIPARAYAALPLGAGAVLWVGEARKGLRSYIAVSGGIDEAPVLGSRSTDTLSGLGPARLEAGGRLSLGVQPGRRARGAVPAPTPGDSTPLLLTATPGPRRHWVDDAGLYGPYWTVAPTSDRTGLRLDGPPLPRLVGGELPSEGLVAGAVQVPPDGRPIVLLRNHPATGGYPVVAVVDDGCLDGLAQRRPGDEVRFTRSDP